MTDFTLQVEAWPDRKNKVLSVCHGNTSTVLARFVSDVAAATFLELVNERITVAYQLGKTGST